MEHGHERSIAVVIPVYNDWQSLFLLLQRLDSTLHQQCRAVKVYVIDDHSSLSSSDFIQQCAQERFNVISHIMQLTLCRNMGHQGAIAIGICHIIQHEDSCCIVIMDADGEDKPEDVPQLLAMMERTNRDAIIFSRRRKRNEQVSFRVMYSLFKALHYFLTGNVMDIGNFSVIPIALAHSLASFPELWNHYPATVIKAKLPTVKVPCDRGRRIAGKSKMSVITLILHGLGSIAVFAPIVGARMLIVMLMLMGVLFLGILCIFSIRFFTELAIPGWATYTTGLSTVLILQSLSMALFFIFLILNSKNPSQSLPKQQYHLFIDTVQTIWEAR